MIPIAAAETEKLARMMTKYVPRATIARTAGLLTVPHLQANTVRLEVLVHLAVTHCKGERKPTSTEIGRWLNQYLGKTQMAILEDPVEDVFVTNVETPMGNRRVFEGIWESNDYFLQVVFETLSSRKVPLECLDLLQPAFALLHLSDCVAERLDLTRWKSAPSTAQGVVHVPPPTRLDASARAVTFTDEDLESLDISRELLNPFVLRDEDRERLTKESTGHSSLERRPLIDFGNAFVLALPHTVSPAIRRFIVSELRQMGHLPAFSKALAETQARQVKEELQELRDDAVPFSPLIHAEGPMPSLHSSLHKYDKNKYLHVVVLHDRLDWLDEHGLSSHMEYQETMKASLEKYLNKVAALCQIQPDFAEGMTLIVMGGLGRGFMMGFKDWPKGWRLSVIRIPDLLMLAMDTDQPIKHYLKCIKQKEWAENQGIFFNNVNGDFNFYCYWRRLDFQLVPQNMPIDSRTMIVIENDFVLPVHQEVRGMVDRHLLQTASGALVRSERFGRDNYFKSMQDRPIYVSIDHLRAGILAGAVESSRGSSWLSVKPRGGDESIRHLLYEIWSGFLGLFDLLVLEIEHIMPDLVADALEIRLDFSRLNVPQDYAPADAKTVIAEPEIIVDFDKRTAEIKFPPDFLAHFQQPGNRGEELLLLTIAKGLVGLHKGTIDDASLITLVAKVTGDEGLRVLHLFRTYYPIEYLLAEKTQKLKFLAHEDLVFAKLDLSDGCTPLEPGETIRSKDACNDFLHRAVTKIWGEVRDILQHLDRTSVIQQALAVHEAVIQDRDRWRQTAQAVIALYSTSDDVFAIAQEREHARSGVAVAARTIVEMAICECPSSGGRELSQWELDELLAKAALLIEVATDSDAIHGELVKPEIQLHANGEYTIDRSFHETVTRPFSAGYFREEFQGAADAYGKLYRKERPGSRTRVDEIYPAPFINAFSSEFGLSPDEMVDGFAELMELAVESNHAVVGTTMGVLRNRLIDARGLSSDACNAFLRTFGLFHRQAWDQPPNGFKEKDLRPWRFSRRLSLTVRPLLAYGENDDDKVQYGVGAVRQSFFYLLDRIERGQLPGDFFMTAEMKKYIGTVSHERGLAFNKTVAKAFRNKGWETRVEVQMTELGAPAELGDIDVLAWKPTGDVLLIESKRLQFARTIAEIAGICQRFRGDTKDDLDKHVRRVSWLKQNAGNIERIVGFKPQQDRIDVRLVTNTHVPMMYLRSLPIPAKKIGRLEGDMSIKY